MEIQLRLDADGRTTYEPNNVGCIAHEPSSSISDQKEVVTARNISDIASVDYSTKAIVLPNLVHLATQNQDEDSNGLMTPYTSLLRDCETVVAMSEENKIHTYWIALDDKPRCLFEQMALDVFHHHIPQNYLYDKRNSGSEWWVQIRPKTKQGEDNNADQLSHNNVKADSIYETIVKNDDDCNSIQFHWDKDEQLRDLTGGAIFVHPHISTVTYLTGKVGAPTMILPCLVDCSSGAPEFCRIDDCYYVSCPSLGKHISFDGRFLHAAPSQLLLPSSTTPTDYFRVTFLVNIWLNHRPIGVQSFPESLQWKLETTTNTSCFQLMQKGGSIFSNCKNDVVGSIDLVKEKDITEIQWLLGANSDAKEYIKVQIPLLCIQRETRTGGTLCLRWHSFHEGIRHVVTSNNFDK